MECWRVNFGSSEVLEQALREMASNQAIGEFATKKAPSKSELSLWFAQTAEFTGYQSRVQGFDPGRLHYQAGLTSL
jgi:hypothetical protein